ncbi:hypothetical protein M513_12889 [Trichuris suis]|uniref:Uncharacterized protein n=1 Tax=Trichuris suis TaxID=68888 RepID=A0A085LMN0_9BILA|nr:hypothetical protein M513_12889 [Trichuris suis]
MNQEMSEVTICLSNPYEHTKCDTNHCHGLTRIVISLRRRPTFWEICPEKYRTTMCLRQIVIK